VLARMLVTTKLLHDAVASVPDAGFLANPSDRRNALQNKIDALDTQLAAADLTGARNNLANDIRKHLVDWLLPDYPTQTQRQYTRAGILGLVDELLDRLGR
jgi:hypothetical protein